MQLLWDFCLNLRSYSLEYLGLTVCYKIFTFFLRNIGRMKAIIWKTISALIVIIFTVYIGVSYVAPRVLLKLPRHINSSSAADYGMRYDDLITVSEDTLDLAGDIIYPFQNNIGDPVTNHSLIVLHPIKTNRTNIYPFVKNFITLGVNFITFDSRAHGDSEGHLYTMGIKEADDISKIIDMIVELYPDHSFGIYGRGNSSNIALRAMSQDPRIQYGIVENFHIDASHHLEYLNVDDIFFSSDLINNQVYKQALDILELDQEQMNIDLQNITQPLLICSTPYNYQEMYTLWGEVCSEKKILNIYNKNIWLNPNIQEDEGFRDCIYEFVELQSEEARNYIKEQVFQPF